MGSKDWLLIFEQVIPGAGAFQKWKASFTHFWVYPSFKVFPKNGTNCPRLGSSRWRGVSSRNGKKGWWTTFRQNCLKALRQKWLTAPQDRRKQQGVKFFAPNYSRKPQFCTVEILTPVDGERLVQRFDSSEVSNGCSVNRKPEGMPETFTPLLSNICSFGHQKKNGSPPDREQNRPFNTQSTFRF